MFVTSYKYLGIEFQQNGRFSTAIKTRILKAQAALFAIQKLCATATLDFPSPELVIKLFRAKILPILTYGSSIWAPKANNTVTGTINEHYFSDNTFDQKAALLNIPIK